MSKKERLDKIKEKQDARAILKQQSELIERQAATEGMSKSAKKMLKKAKKEKKHNDSVLFLILRIIMLVALGFSGIYYGGVTILGVLSGYMNDMPKWTAAAMGVGIAVIIIGIIFSFCKKHMLSFVFILGGTASYMRAAIYIVGKITKKLETYSGANPDLMEMDKEYMQHYYPILIILICSLIITVIWFSKTIKKKKKLKEIRDNAPVKSIVNL